MTTSVPRHQPCSRIAGMLFEINTNLSTAGVTRTPIGDTVLVGAFGPVARRANDSNAVGSPAGHRLAASSRDRSANRWVYVAGRDQVRSCRDRSSTKAV